MTSTALVTGGAGFIGCALSKGLADRFDTVVALDNLHPQIHPVAERPEALDERVTFVRGDVTSAGDWDALLADHTPDVVIHLAAETGTGQSLSEATRHAEVNVSGTTQMLDAFTRRQKMPAKIVLTSSRAVYGEGAWQDASGRLTYPGQRGEEMLAQGVWDFPGLTPTPFESSRVKPTPTSVYGATKLAQENILTSWAFAMRVTPVLYRLQNVYGPGQSLSNPYTGIVSFFAQKARAGEVIPVYEDGDIVRDFVFIDDVVSAILAGVDRSGANVDAYDIGSGEATSVLELARLIAEIYGAPEPQINGAYRNGDVRHASADITAAKAALDWAPQVPVSEGVRRLCAWIDETLSA